MNVIDSGVPGTEYARTLGGNQQADIYEAYKGYMAFVEGAAL